MPSVVRIMAGHRPGDPLRQLAVPIAQPSLLLTKVRSLTRKPASRPGAGAELVAPDGVVPDVGLGFAAPLPPWPALEVA
jgi:hypothetical protein